MSVRLSPPLPAPPLLSPPPGKPDGTWKVEELAPEIPPHVPEPTLGIICARDLMKRSQWFLLLAAFSDAWLMSTLFFQAARANFNEKERFDLFSLVNKHPTVVEAVMAYHNRGRGDPRPPVYDSSAGPSAEPTSTSPQAAPFVANPPPPRFRPVVPEDLRAASEGGSPAVCVGSRVRLCWLDDGKWYDVEIKSLDVQAMTAR